MYTIDKLVVFTIFWGVFTVWSQLTATDGWKVLTDKDQMIKRLLPRNGRHLSILGESPFAKGDLTEAICKDGEGEDVEGIL